VNATTARSDASGRTTFGERGGKGERPLKAARAHPGKLAGYHPLGRSGATVVPGVKTITEKADEPWRRPYPSENRRNIREDLDRTWNHQIGGNALQIQRT